MRGVQRPVVSSAFVLLTLAVIGCGGPDSAVNVGDPNNVLVREADLARPLELRLGQIMEIVLTENLAAGYRWKCVPTPPTRLELLGDEYLAPVGSAEGHEGTRHFLVQATGIGDAAVTLQRSQTGAGAHNEDALTLVVRVRRPSFLP